MTATKEPETIVCHECGSETPFDESLGAEVGKRGQWKDVCRECYDGIVSTCQICGEDAMPSDVSEFILCKAELSTTGDRPPGIYRIAHRPFLSIPLIGSGSLHGNDVLFVDKIPKPDCHYEISGHICNKCAGPYRRTFERVYRIRKSLAPAMREMRGCKGRQAKWMAVLTSCMNNGGWGIQRNHTRRTILQNPDMLRDLECDQVSKDPDGKYLNYSDDTPWRDLKKIYDLPDLPTFHEWVFLKHKGVKVFSVCGPDEDFNGGWLSLRPEPRYRNGAGRLHPETFAPGSLPTFPSAPEGEYHSPYDWARVHVRDALKSAIEQGFIRQDGCFDKDDKPTIYG